ncbi:MAG TPA: ABC transporter permease subunit [Jiangellaceae bacterium]|nr:ABC transporter permease subunit [Jiangellaceae bacterium]
MSTSDALVVDRPTVAVADRPSRATARFLRSELRLVFRRRRNLAMLAVLAAAPILLGIIVRLTSPAAGEGPPLLNQVTQNGFFLGLASLVFASPLFLPMVMAVVSGDSVAGEASNGTLRNLLVVPTGRTRLLLVKYTGIAAYALACVGIIVVSGLVTGWILFPAGDVVLLSGAPVGLAEALGRAGLVVLYVGAMLATLGAIGLFFSTLTEVPMGAMAATVTVAVVSQILDAIPQIEVIHEYLQVHWWLAFMDLLREPMLLDNVLTGLLVSAAYVAVFGSLAWARLTTKDVTS